MQITLIQRDALGKRSEDFPVTMLVARRIREFVRRSESVFRIDSVDEGSVFLDHDGIGLELG
jgi:hypothetical protein